MAVSGQSNAPEDPDIFKGWTGVQNAMQLLTPPVHLPGQVRVLVPGTGFCGSGGYCH